VDWRVRRGTPGNGVHLYCNEVTTKSEKVIE
jgi:hypothetical protein